MVGRECAKCQARMEQGFIVDQGESTYRVGAWQGGEPKKGFWGGIKTKRSLQIPITTWRCTRCFYLESYAPNPSPG